MTLLSLFSGAGGLDLGFVKAGFRPIWAIDNFDEAAATYARNIGAHIICGDIRECDLSTVPQADGVIGGFPCQGFSVANIRRSSKDGRNRLYLEFVRVLHEKKPKFFLAENVKGILSLGAGKVFSAILTDFEDAGYAVKHALLNAADFGVPQTRQRVFILGIRQGVRFNFDAFPPKPTHQDPTLLGIDGLLPWVNVGDALSSIPDPASPHALANHDYSRYKLTFNGYLGHRSVDARRPAPTITARGDHRGGVVVLHHPSNERRISAREAATIQSFPQDFEFVGARTSAYRQIANAVPPLLAERIARSIIAGFAAPPGTRGIR